MKWRHPIDSEVWVGVDEQGIPRWRANIDVDVVLTKVRELIASLDEWADAVEDSDDYIRKHRPKLDVEALIRSLSDDDKEWLRRLKRVVKYLASADKTEMEVIAELRQLDRSEGRNAKVGEGYGKPATRRLTYNDFGIIITDNMAAGPGQQTVRTASYGANRLGFDVGEFVHIRLGRPMKSTSR